ncbi:alpha/beta fold hydrolase [Microbacterium sp. SSM24]|uniref:alpha/beta fold hydrolase n=1 Tax=Microbacterium sp. SSM24 TaxID=2991714 RepID=UPI002227FE8B|nr:alpha/beta hydrolase [Microbacterium sp. SSM24]MCW3493000.1 alpha/beta hydrolase [Microbacterium sp. SSM24]
MNTTTPTAVLVHGAFADASGFAGIIRELVAQGYDVVAPANPLRGVAHDAAAIRGAAAAVDGPVVLVGHSYGGAVITQAAEGLDNLKGLVYLAAFAPAVGESVGSVQEPFPAPLLASTVRPTPYDAVGAVGGPDLVIDRARFRETFAADVAVDLVDVMAASQRPLAAAAAGEPLTHAGWDAHPTWYLVSSRDRAIAPEAQRFMAERMGATTREIDGSHTAFVARPAEVAAFIGEALTALGN